MDQHLINRLKEIIIQAGEMSISLRDAGLVIHKKKDDSPVTNADLAISEFIYNNLTKISQNISVICEEQSEQIVTDQEMFWLVDPIDGTKSYIKNIDNFTVNIALVARKTPVIGLIYVPAIRKLYFTSHDGKLCIEQDGQQVAINASKRQQGLVAVVSSRKINTRTEQFITNNNFSEVIAMPSSIKLCMVAEGVADVYPKFGPTMEWDIAAGHALINANNGMVIEYATGEVLSYGKTGFINPDFVAVGDRAKHYVIPAEAGI